MVVEGYYALARTRSERRVRRERKRRKAQAAECTRVYARPSNRESSSNGDRPIVDEQMTAHAISSPDAVAHRTAIGGEATESAARATRAELTLVRRSSLSGPVVSRDSSVRTSLPGA